MEKKQENSRKRERSAMPRTQRLIIGDETAVYHVPRYVQNCT